MAKGKQATPLIVEEEEEGFQVTDEVNPDDIGDLTDVKRDDTIPAAKGVWFQIREGDGATVETRRDKTEDGGDGETVLLRLLRLRVIVGENGIDGAGVYAGHMMFLDLPLTLDEAAIKAKWERQVNAGTRQAGKGFNIKWHAGVPNNYELVDFKELALATGLAVMHEVTAEDTKLIQKGRSVGSIVWQMTGPINDDLLAILNVGDTGFVADISRSEGKGDYSPSNKLARFRVPVAE
jgi:hypothetical protein